MLAEFAFNVYLPYSGATFKSVDGEAKTSSAELDVEPELKTVPAIERARGIQSTLTD